VPSNEKELDAQLEDLAKRDEALVEIVRRLATHMSVVAVALRDPQAVPPADLDAAVAGIAEISSMTGAQPSAN
jgi:hypothetical protein